MKDDFGMCLSWIIIRHTIIMVSEPIKKNNLNYSNEIKTWYITSYD